MSYWDVVHTSKRRERAERMSCIVTAKMGSRIFSPPFSHGDLGKRKPQGGVLRGSGEWNLESLAPICF